MSNDIGLWSNF